MGLSMQRVIHQPSVIFKHILDCQHEFLKRLANYILNSEICMHKVPGGLHSHSRLMALFFSQWAPPNGTPTASERRQKAPTDPPKWIKIHRFILYKHRSPCYAQATQFVLTSLILLH